MRDNKGFRGKFLGGFNRGDVLDYIEKLSSERNSLAEENEKLRGRIEALENHGSAEYQPDTAPEAAQENAPDNEEETAKTNAAAVIERTGALLEDIERRYEILRADVEVGTAHVKCEMDNVSERFDAINEALRTAGEGISALREELGSRSRSGE